jgi:hypothetical protein
MRTAAIALCVIVSGGLISCAPDPSEEDDLSTDLEEADREVGIEDVLRELGGDGAGQTGSGQSALVAPPGRTNVTPEDVFIESISTGGPGCPDPSTVTTVISADRTTFLVIYDQMILNNPPGPAIKNLNCVAGVKLHVPNGWQVSLATVDTRGYAYLSQGVKARQTSEYFFAGQPLGAAYHSLLTGFYDADYQFTDLIPFQSIVWSPCGASAIFAINTKLNLNAVSNPNGLAYFNTQTTDGKFEKILHWQWQQC